MRIKKDIFLKINLKNENKIYNIYFKIIYTNIAYA